MDRFEHTVEIDAPVTVCYRMWHRFEDFPEFMTHVKSVSATGNGRWHWVVEAPFGRTVEWNAEIDADDENARIGWHTVDDSEIDMQGEVRFEPVMPNRTRVIASIRYETPAGELGNTVADLFKNPQGMVEDDLENFKDMVEHSNWSDVDAISGYDGPLGIEPAPITDSGTVLLEADVEDINAVGTPYLGDDGALGHPDEIDMRDDTLTGQEADVFDRSMDVFEEDLESFYEDLDEDLDSSYVLTEDIHAYEGYEGGEDRSMPVPESNARTVEKEKSGS